VVDRQFCYGLSSGDVFATDITPQPSGSKFVLHVPNNRIEVDLKLPGNFNIYNALAAGAVALANNINVTVLKQALEKVSAIPGRYESIDCGQKYNIIVDYAHTEESLEGLLSMYKGLAKGKIYLVFGATGGGRDTAKRPKMGVVADKLADYIVLTDDDPYEENEWLIIEDIAKGIKRNEGNNFWKIPNRGEAIELVLCMAKDGDTVLIAGKGAEEIQMIGGKAVAWDDRKAVRNILSREKIVSL